MSVMRLNMFKEGMLNWAKVRALYQPGQHGEQY